MFWVSLPSVLVKLFAFGQRGTQASLCQRVESRAGGRQLPDPRVCGVYGKFMARSYSLGSPTLNPALCRIWPRAEVSEYLQLTHFVRVVWHVSCEVRFHSAVIIFQDNTCQNSHALPLRHKQHHKQVCPFFIFKENT